MDVPLAPENVEVVRAAGSDDSLIVYWSFIPYSDDRASTVTSFVVQWSTNSSFDSVSETVLSVGDSLATHRLPINSRNTQTYNITSLVPGKTYFVRVCGVNTMGRGLWAPAAFVQYNLFSISAGEKPDAIAYGFVQVSTIPASKAYSVLDSSSSLKVAFSMPSNSHGSNVSSFLVEWFDTPIVPEIWTVSVTATSSITGSFRLKYNNDITDYIPCDASADSSHRIGVSLRYSLCSGLEGYHLLSREWICLDYYFLE